MTAKEIKEAAKGACRERLVSPDDYWFTPDEMQAFEEAICREQREAIMKLINDSHYTGHRTKPLTINEIAEIVINASKPTT